MQPPPSPADFLKYPVTVGVGVLAVATTVAWHVGKDISPLFMNFQAWQGQLWRLFTSALPHVDIIHLLFNLYWLWAFGALVEEAFGRLRTAAIFLFFAGGSAAAEYAVFEGGVGLSGVGYGLFSLLWVLSPRDNRFHDAVDARTAGLFVAWFFLCIALTASGTWAVANVAHGMGAVQGILLGFALTAQRGKPLVITCLAGLMVFVFAAATVGRPIVNFSRNAGAELAYVGYLDLVAERNESAAALYERAVQFDDRQATWWYNLGIAYQRLDREPEMTEAYRHAAKLEPSSVVYRKTLTERLSLQGFRKLTAGDGEGAAGLIREALDLDDQNALNWFYLGASYKMLGHRESATSAYERAIALDPDNALFQNALKEMRGAPK